MVTKRYSLRLNGGSHDVEVVDEGEGIRARIGDRWHTISMEPIGHAGLYSLMVDGRVYEVFAEKRSDGFNLIIGRQLYAVGVESPLHRSTEDAVDEQAEGADWMVVSPMTGTVVEVMVQAGQQVRAGDVLLVLEAMKMNSEIRAQRAGTVEEVLVQPGQLITRGTTMLVLR